MRKVSEEKREASGVESSIEIDSGIKGEFRGRLLYGGVHFNIGRSQRSTLVQREILVIGCSIDG